MERLVQQIEKFARIAVPANLYKKVQANPSVLTVLEENTKRILMKRSVSTVQLGGTNLLKVSKEKYYL